MRDVQREGRRVMGSSGWDDEHPAAGMMAALVAGHARATTGTARPLRAAMAGVAAAISTIAGLSIQVAPAHNNTGTSREAVTSSTTARCVDSAHHRVVAIPLDRAGSGGLLATAACGTTSRACPRAGARMPATRAGVARAHP